MMQEALGFRLKIEFAQASDPGRDPNKQVNEDSCGYAETRLGYLCVLCDGMGGHYGGKEASRTAITTIFEMFDQAAPGTSPAQALKGAIEEAGRRVYLLGGPPENRTRPGSTVVAMLLHDRGLDVAHVGDSRAYIIRSNQIYPLTRDHSMVQGMIDAGMLTEESAMGHPDSNKITRALGMKPDVDVEVRPEPMELFAGDLMLQSSDGLTDLALGRDILAATRQALASGPVSHACTMLVQLANDRGGHDNITVQMVKVLEVGQKATIPERPPAAAPAAMAPQSMPNPVAMAPQAAGPAYGAPPQAAAYGAPPQAAAYGAPPQAAPSYGAPPQGSPFAPPAETRAMTSPGGPPPNNGGAQQQWAPVMPTTPDQTPMPPGAMAGRPPGGSPPTLNEPLVGPPSARGQPWTSEMYNGPPVTGGPQGPQMQPPAGLGGYRLDGGAGGLPLPPPRVYGAQPGGPQPMPGMGQPMGAPMGAQFGPGMQGGVSPAARGGIVFVIIGLSAVIAVLILVVVWALWLR
jgi:protein phosphatase